ncbi:MAG: sigma-70 family RNA polymerase sigma factor [Ktedonobacteraceae bacterium]
MSICMDETLNQMKLMTLTDLSNNQLQRHQHEKLADDLHCLELFRRALSEQTDDAWPVLQQCFSETIRRWIWSHPSRDVALLRDSEENYIAQTFSRFWYAVHEQHIEFTTLSAALRYLHATLNGLLTDTLRAHLRRRTREVLLSELECSEEPIAADSTTSQSIWESIQQFLPDERERRVAYLLYHCGLKPRDIVMRYRQEFDDVKEIYRLNHNIVERLRRNRDRLRHILGHYE